jgi:hypothetical protein
MKNRRNLVWGKAVCLIACAAALGRGSVARAQLASDVVAYSGQPIDARRVFEVFDDPAINDDGNIVYWAWDSFDTPDNDECAGAIDVSLGTTTLGNHFATPSASPAWCGTDDVWLRFTASSTTQHTLYGFLCVGTTNVIPAVAIYTGTCGALTQVAQNCSTASTTFAAQAGTTYYIRVGSRPGQEPWTATIDLRDTSQGSYYATPRSHQHALWLQGPSGGPELIVREGDPTPFDPDRTFRSSYFPALGPGDDITVLASTRGNSITNEITRASLVRSMGGAVQELYRDNDVGTPPNWLAPIPQVNAAGRLAYALNDGSELHYGDTTVLAGEHAPGTPDGVTFQLLEQPVSSAGVPVAFRARLQGTGVNDTNDLGLWADLGNGLALVARAGDAAPGAGAGVVWKEVGLDPAVAASGTIAFYATLTGTGVTADNDAGIWIGSPGDLHLAARKGDAAPGVADATFLSLDRQVRINSAGSAVVRASLVGDAIDVSNNTGLWTLGVGAAPALLAREGDPIASLPGVALDNFFDPILDDSGSVFVMARVRGTGVDPSNNELLMQTRAGGRRVIARRGDMFQLPTMETKTIARVVFGDWGPGAGRAVTNHQRQIVYRLVFTDSSEAIVRATDACVADWNSDGVVNSNDFFAFLVDFFDGHSDVNGDGVTNSQDFFDFLAAFFNGCE